LDRFALGCRGLRISCCIVGIPVLPVSLLHINRAQANAHAVHFAVPRASAKHKNRMRPLVRGNDAVGFQRIEAQARILTTSNLKSAVGRPPVPR